MKRIIPFLLFLLALTACGQKAPVPLEDLPADYSLEQAKSDGVVVHEDGDISSGQDAWDAFAETTSEGKAASIRLGYYYTLDEPSRYDPEYYESIKDDYPVLYIQDLSYDGQTYTLTGIENGELYTKTYNYLVRYEDDAPERASYDRSIAYALLNDKDIAEDETMTYFRLFESLASSRLEDFIDFNTVYLDYIYDGN